MATTYDDSIAPKGGMGAAGSTIESMKDKVGDAASQAKEKASKLGKSAVEGLDKNVHGAASALEGSAQKLRSVGASGGKVAELTETAASKLEDTADYLKGYDTQEAFERFEDWTRANPAMAIGSALAIGFVIGMTLSRD